MGEGERWRRLGRPPSADDLTSLADHALADIPTVLRAQVRDVVIVVEEIADDETLDALSIDNPWDLTGLYRGVPFGHAELAPPGSLPATIHLYRQPILLEWIETDEELFRLLRNVLIHEIAHHFGFTDADIERLERE